MNATLGWGHGSGLAYGAGTVLLQTTGYRDVRDDEAPSWVYRQFADGRIQILQGASGVGSFVTPGTAAYAAIISRIGNWTGGAGPEVAASVDTSSTATKGGLSAFLSWAAGAIQSGAQNPEVQAAATEAAQTLGPAVSQGVAQLLSSRGKSLDQLYKTEAKLRTQLATGKYGLFGTQAGTAAKLEATQRQIAALEAAQASAQAALAVPTTGSAGLPSWLPLGIGGFALVLLAALLLTRKRGRR